MTESLISHAPVPAVLLAVSRPIIEVLHYVAVVERNVAFPFRVGEDGHKRPITDLKQNEHFFAFLHLNGSDRSWLG